MMQSVGKPRNAHSFFTWCIVAVFCPLGVQTLWSQPIIVGPNIHVSTDRPTLPHSETLLATDPNDASRMVGVSMAGLAWHQNVLVYLSDDGGKTWKLTLDTLRSFGQEDVQVMDPASAYGPDGTAYVSVLVLTNAGITIPYMFRSQDGGKTWGRPVLLPAPDRGVDREYIVADNTSGQYRGRVYVNAESIPRGLNGDRQPANFTLWRSLDAGGHFDSPVKRTSSGPPVGRHTIIPCNSVIMSDGRLVSMFFESSDADKYETGTVGNKHVHYVRVLKAVLSSDGGGSLSDAIKISDFYDSSTTTADKYVLGFPYLAVDQQSKEFKDRLYAVWADGRSGHDQIFLSYSSDRGTSWSKPRKVSDSPVVTDPAINDDSFAPVVAVNRDGVVGVMYHKSEPDYSLGVRFTASLDGGDTFLPSVPVSEKPLTVGKDRWGPFAGRSTKDTTPTEPLHVFIGPDLDALFIGHTTGMAASADGVFHPFFVNNRTGVKQVWTAPVTVKGVASLDGSGVFTDLTDITDKATLQLSDVQYDLTKDTVSIVACIKNEAKEPLGGPIHVRVVSLGSEGSDEVRILNSDNKQTGTGAIWDFVQSSAIMPGELSEPKTLTFHLKDPRVTEKFYLDFIKLDVRLLKKAD